MKQLDEMERMANYVRDVRGHVPPINAATDLDNLAEFVCAVMPIIRAAFDWRDRGPGQSHCDEEDCPCTSIVCRLKAEIDTLRRGMGE